LRDSAFSRFGTAPVYDDDDLLGFVADRRTHDDSIHRARIASRCKM